MTTPATFPASMITLPEYITVLRRRVPLTLEEAATKMHMSRRHLNCLELGQIDPHLADLLTMSQVYGVSLESLVAPHSNGQE